MRCFGRAFGFAAGTLLALDLMVLRFEDLAAVLWPAHFFFTAVFAAALDAVFLAMLASRSLMAGRLAQKRIS
jgi:hypothetical protein